MSKKQIRVITLGGNTTGTVTETQKIEWAVGKLHIAKLLKVRFQCDETLASADQTCKWAIYSKDKTPPTNIEMNLIAGDKGFICGGRWGYQFDTDGMAIAEYISEFNTPPEGDLIFVRPAQFLVDGVQSFKWGAWIYYVREEVSEVEMEKLMLKDHP